VVVADITTDDVPYVHGNDAGIIKLANEIAVCRRYLQCETEIVGPTKIGTGGRELGRLPDAGVRSLLDTPSGWATTTWQPVADDPEMWWCGCSGEVYQRRERLSRPERARSVWCAAGAGVKQRGRWQAAEYASRASWQRGDKGWRCRERAATDQYVQ
jgi:hypothetical protein